LRATVINLYSVSHLSSTLKRWLATLMGREEGMSHKLLHWSRQIKICDEMIGWQTDTSHTLGRPVFRLELTRAAFIRNSSDFFSNGLKITSPQSSITTNYLMQNQNRMKNILVTVVIQKHSMIKIFKRPKDSISSPL
jgi:hypothetical protein